MYIILIMKLIYSAIYVLNKHMYEKLFLLNELNLNVPLKIKNKILKIYKK